MTDVQKTEEMLNNEKIAEAKNGLVDALSLYPDSSSNEQLQIWFVCVKEG